VFDWLFEGKAWVYAILGGAVVILAALWVRDRKRRWLYPIGGLLVLVGCTSSSTWRWDAPRRDQAQAAGDGRRSQKRDTEGIFRHISDRFKLGTLDKAGSGRRLDAVLRAREVEDLRIWDVVADDERGKVVFKAKPHGSRTGTAAYYLIRGEFVRDGDGQWRLRTFEVFNPFIESRNAAPAQRLPELSGLGSDDHHRPVPLRIDDAQEPETARAPRCGPGGPREARDVHRVAEAYLVPLSGPGAPGPAPASPRRRVREGDAPASRSRPRRSRNSGRGSASFPALPRQHGPG